MRGPASIAAATIEAAGASEKGSLTLSALSKEMVASLDVTTTNVGDRNGA